MKNGEVVIAVRLPKSHKIAIIECAEREHRSLNNWCWLALMEAANKQLKQTQGEKINGGEVK